ncbi:hypothetical protein B0H13DRAFT_2056160 [Mycena leptocephala]|nr:hypothetical protein B0H13DRAFT_2056160 [Mycena leptocephala]
MSRIFRFVLLLFHGTFACSSLQQSYSPPILSSDTWTSPPFDTICETQARPSCTHEAGALFFEAHTISPVNLLEIVPWFAFLFTSHHCSQLPSPVSLTKISWQSLLSLLWPRQLLKELVGMTSATTHPRRRHER